jgi:Amt family ammonium transporter
MDEGDTSFLIICSALVMLMTPGLGFFYGGLVRHKNLVSTIGYCFICFSVVSIVWYLISFSMVFAPSSNGSGFIGDLTYAALENVGYSPHTFYGTTVPFIAFFFFQLKFAAITPALIIGAIAERIKFVSFLVFLVIWSLLVYAPIGHWVWNPQGWAFQLGAIDFAGGVVVHISAGCSALAGAIVTGKRHHKGEHVPCNIPLVLLGTAMLWFGWFGFNGGSALAANGIATNACIVTDIAAAAASLTWNLCEYIHKRNISISGFAIGGVCGLVAITPASGYVTAWAAIIIGIMGAGFPYLFCLYKNKYKLFDDTLDAFGCHGVGGLVGTFCTGLFATTDVNPAGQNGAFYGNPDLLWKQIIVALAAFAWSFCVTVIILLALKYTIGLRVSKEEEEKGLDKAILQEEAWDGDFLNIQEQLQDLRKAVATKSAEFTPINSKQVEIPKF